MASTSDERAAIIEGLNVFRALEAWGARLYAAWAANEPDARLAAGHLIIAEREATHARLLAERLRALGAAPAPACVDAVLAEQLAEIAGLQGFVAQLDGLRRVTERDTDRMADCRLALERGRAAAEATDPDTYAFLRQLYGEEKVSAAWYRHTYGEMTGRHPRSDALPLLTSEQLVRRADSARPASPTTARAQSRGA